jgi:hypothetical protein
VQQRLAHLDRPVRVELTGAGGGSWTIAPASDTTDGLLRVVEGAYDAAVVVTSSAHAFVSWGTQRSRWHEHCRLAGDTDYGAAVLDALNIV